MLERVVQGFPRDAVELGSDCLRQVLAALDRQLGLHSPAFLYGGQSGPKGSGETRALEAGAVQLEDEEPHLAQRLLRGIADLAQMPGGRADLAGRYQVRRGLGVQVHRIQRLRDRIVELPREAEPLLGDRQFLVLLPGGFQLSIGGLELEDERYHQGSEQDADREGQAFRYDRPGRAARRDEHGQPSDEIRGPESDSAGPYLPLEIGLDADEREEIHHVRLTAYHGRREHQGA